ncbi:hypothetical protein D7D52_33990 [Nocardia yunnanensis]|uniref:Loricrin n=1 Tax=Nocardia yunnanensis TaxID=2382165 RepID=A0A386ZJF7_9NOCA|nr:hypothetical protein D7D52_33990 [Nocardia yunnanensis]
MGEFIATAIAISFFFAVLLFIAAWENRRSASRRYRKWRSGGSVGPYVGGIGSCTAGTGCTGGGHHHGGHGGHGHGGHSGCGGGSSCGGGGCGGGSGCGGGGGGC